MRRGSVMAEFLLDPTTTMLGKVLDGSAARQRVLANNIANQDTPGFTRSDVSFEDQLHEIMTRGGSDVNAQMNDLGQAALEINEDNLSPRQADGNNVDVEREMVAVSKNSLQYESAAQMLNMKFTALKSAISEGKR